jgi:hypothetical protein
VKKLEDVRPATWLDYGSTCDWGHCDAETYALRWAEDVLGGTWLPVCQRHAAHGDVLVTYLGDLPELDPS